MGDTEPFNFTKAAEENNAENLLIIHDKKLPSLYEPFNNIMANKLDR